MAQRKRGKLQHFGYSPMHLQHHRVLSLRGGGSAVDPTAVCLRHRASPPTRNNLFESISPRFFDGCLFPTYHKHHVRLCAGIVEAEGEIAYEGTVETELLRLQQSRRGGRHATIVILRGRLTLRITCVAILISGGPHDLQVVDLFRTIKNGETKEMGVEAPHHFRHGAAKCVLHRRRC